MGVRGPTPKSAELRLLEGSRAHRPLPAPAAVKYTPGMPERPKGMTAAARRIWESYIEQLAPMGILRPVDGFALARLCEDVAMLQELQAGQRRLAREMRREAKEMAVRASARVSEIEQESAALMNAPEPAGSKERLEALNLEREDLKHSARASGGALIDLTMSPEGRRLATTINTLASRIKRDEMQFGLTPVASQRTKDIMLPGASTPGSTGMDAVEAALCG